MQTKKQSINKHEFPPSIGKVAYRNLISQGIMSLEQACKFTEKELLHIHGVGPKAVKIIKEELLKLNKSLKNT